MKFKQASLKAVMSTSYKGRVETTIDRLIEVFGQPQNFGDPKTKYEWQIVFEDGTVATIYDYHGSHLRNSWHIGGKSDRAVELVRQAIWPVYKEVRVG